MSHVPLIAFRAFKQLNTENELRNYINRFAIQTHAIYDEVKLILGLNTDFEIPTTTVGVTEILKVQTYFGIEH